MSGPELMLAAEDAEDIEIISARLQDAVAPLKELVWMPKKRRFAALFNRFKWEDGHRNANVRVRSVLHFDGVLSAKSINLKRGAPDAVVSLLAVRFAPRGADDPGGVIELVFSGGGAIRLDVECVDAGLTDVGREWAARSTARIEMARRLDMRAPDFERAFAGLLAERAEADAASAVAAREIVATVRARGDAALGPKRWRRSDPPPSFLRRRNGSAPTPARSRRA